MSHVQQVDDEVSINFKDPSETILSYNKGLDYKSKSFDEDETLGYSLPNGSGSKSEKLKETSIGNMCLVGGKIPVTIISRSVGTLSQTPTSPTSSEGRDMETKSLGSPNNISNPVTPKVKPIATQQDAVDRFNGIFYHVFNKDGQISILFPNDYLYKQFVDTLMALSDYNVLANVCQRMKN